MRFISVLAAVGTAIGTTFDFGLALGPEPVDWSRGTSPDAGFSASFDGQPSGALARFSQPATAAHSTATVAID